MYLPPSELQRFFQLRSSVTVIAAMTPTLVARAASNRIAILFSPGAAQSLNLWPDGSVSGTKGLLLTANAGILELHFRDVGPLVTGEWWAFSTAGGFSLSVLETIYGQNVPLDEGSDG